MMGWLGRGKDWATGLGKRGFGRLPQPVRAPIHVLVRTFKLYGDDDCGIYAAAIAYYALFSLVPIALITLSIFGWVVDREAIVDFVFAQLPLQETVDVRDNVDEIVQQSKRLSGPGFAIGILVLLWSAGGLFSAVRRGLNATRHVRQSRPFWQGKLVDLALLFGVGTLITLSIGMTAITRVAVERAGDLGFVEINAYDALELLSYGLSAFVSLVMFALLYRLVPTARPRWREALYGAVFATILFELTKHLAALVIQEQSFARDSAIYAGVASVFAFLLWIFISGSILLLGAEFGRAAVNQDSSAEEQRVARPVFWRRMRGPHRARSGPGSA